MYGVLPFTGLSVGIYALIGAVTVAAGVLARLWGR